MPVYNAGSFLKPAINSILEQSYKNFELILVDDGATDGSGELCDIFAKIDSRIRVIHQDNAGICTARNTGLKNIAGEWTAFCDHDDLYERDFLKKSIDVINKEPEVDLVKFGYITNYVSKKFSYRVYSKSSNGNYSVEEVVNNYPVLNQCVKALWNGLYRSSVITQNNIKFDPFYLSGVEDYDFNLKYMRFCHKIVTIEECLFIHFMRNGQSTDTKFSENKLQSWERVAGIESELIIRECTDEVIKRKQLLQCYNKYLTSIMSCLLGEGCNWNVGKKKEYLAKLREGSVFFALDNWKAKDKQDISLKQRISFGLFFRKHYILTIAYMKAKIVVGNFIRTHGDKIKA